MLSKREKGRVVHRLPFAPRSAGPARASPPRDDRQHEVRGMVLVVEDGLRRGVRIFRSARGRAGVGVAVEARVSALDLS